MNNPTISRFATATKHSEPDIAFTAPVEAATGEHNFKQVLEALADYRTESGVDHYFSFSRWDEGHSSWSHNGTTCITLEFEDQAARLVREILIGADILHYEFPTKAKRKNAIMFALPSEDHFDHEETTRAASLIMNEIAVKGLLPCSYLSTYFFRFRKGAKIEQRGSIMLHRGFVDDSAGVFVTLKEWLA